MLDFDHSQHSPDAELLASPFGHSIASRLYLTAYDLSDEREAAGEPLNELDVVIERSIIFVRAAGDNVVEAHLGKAPNKLAIIGNHLNIAEALREVIPALVELLVVVWDCGGNPGPKRDRERGRMFSLEQRRAALETFVRYDHSYADTIAELGYPTRTYLRNWWKEYEETGGMPAGGNCRRRSRHTEEQARDAVGYYLEHGKSLARTMRKIGYPKGSSTLRGWIDELAPGERKERGPGPKRGPVKIGKKAQTVAELEARTAHAAETAERHGVSRGAPYAWRRELTGDNGGAPEGKGEPVSKEFNDLPDDLGQVNDMLREAKMQLRRVQLELNVRKATLEIVKKRPGRRPEPADEHGEGGDGGGAQG